MSTFVEKSLSAILRLSYCLVEVGAINVSSSLGNDNDSRAEVKHVFSS